MFGYDKITFDAIMKCEFDSRRELSANVILSGGTTMFPGIRERISDTLIKLSPLAMQIQVAAH